jgi:hypothetical protein
MYFRTLSFLVIDFERQSFQYWNQFLRNNYKVNQFSIMGNMVILLSTMSRSQRDPHSHPNTLRARTFTAQPRQWVGLNVSSEVSSLEVIVFSVLESVLWRRREAVWKKQRAPRLLMKWICRDSDESESYLHNIIIINIINWIGSKLVIAFTKCYNVITVINWFLLT